MALLPCSFLGALGCVLCAVCSYMAPELLSGKKGNSSIDVYSFGMLAFELFTSTVPYAGSTAQQTTMSIVKGERRGCYRVVPIRATFAACRACVKNPVVYTPRPTRHVVPVLVLQWQTWFLHWRLHDGAVMINSGTVLVPIPPSGYVAGTRPEFPPAVVVPDLAEKIITECWFALRPGFLN